MLAGGHHRRGGHRPRRHPRLPAHRPHRRTPASPAGRGDPPRRPPRPHHRGLDTVVDALHTTHRAYHWVHALPNTALIAAALTHANGDFSGSICRAVSGGWDTDSNGATAGSVAGLLTGTPAALPDRWTTPLKNRLATSVADFDGIGLTPSPS